MGKKWTKAEIDILMQNSDDYIEPCDIARSTRLNYLFTICEE